MIAHESQSRSFAKAVSWRITGSIDTVILAVVFTGDVRVGLSIGASEFITKIILFWLHERVWSNIQWGYDR